jgi:glutathione S-transferase
MSSPQRIGTTSAKPVLGYWSVRGLAAQLRYMLKYAEVDFEDDLYPQVFDENATGYNRWNGDAWWTVYDKKGLEMPNLPYFIDGDVKLSMSSAIARYICAKWKPELLGRTPAEQGYAAMVEMALVDANSEFDSIAFSVEGTSEKMREASKEHLAPVHKFLGEKPFLCGDAVTFVDFILFEMIDKCQAGYIWDGKFFAEFPAFEAYFARIEALPNVMGKEERASYGTFSGWRAKLGGAGEDMFERYKQIGKYAPAAAEER